VSDDRQTSVAASALYSAEKYTYRVLWSEDQRHYVGVCSEFPALTSTAATHDGALGGIISAVGAHLEKWRTTGEAIPVPLAIRQFKGSAR
jgi:predicted RNase H-like HicB family nuclease